VRWSFYKKTTGAFTGFGYAGTIELLPINTPEDCDAIEGTFDHLSQRVDLSALRMIEELDPVADADKIAELRSRVVYDYQPPQPDDNHEWDIDVKRWQLKPEIAARQRDIEHAKSEIAILEASQLRALREFAIGAEGAAQRLKDIDDQIAIQRQIIKLNS
jgi:hypothetical protein